ncbi:MAG TPA: 2-hydroxychromene-2-carboxylate isomerase [Burkholderiales bacterium]|jgi:2-hydroxychromene-2-carboxylate isomerase|nr:2-hydroxychromene-2-carboxylate isomerase [Burkholderiales bacterium]HEX2650499.1 2-hydroxychromene-2-carboxylate isomerase [Burkholderiales bacterium]
MSKQVDFYFDFGSPTAYLAWTQLPAIAMECRAAIAWKPMLLGGVFKATGNQSPVLIEPKGKWMWGDMERWARRYGVKLVKNPFFILNTLTLMRGAIGYQVREPERFLRYVDAMFRALWVDGRNLGDAGVVAQTLREAGFDAEAFTQMTADLEVKQKLIRATEEAVKRGVFGAPTMFVGSEMFFGQDRLEFVREALRR